MWCVVGENLHFGSLAFEVCFKFFKLIQGYLIVILGIMTLYGNLYFAHHINRVLLSIGKPGCF